MRDCNRAYLRCMAECGCLDDKCCLAVCQRLYRECMGEPEPRTVKPCW